MNKAQKEYIDSWFLDGDSPELSQDHLYSIRVNKYDLTGFAKEFLEIDGTPDPETYCVWVNHADGTDMPLLGVTGLPKEEAVKMLQNTMRSILPECVLQYKRGEYLFTASGTEYDVRLDK